MHILPKEALEKEVYTIEQNLETGATQSQKPQTAEDYNKLDKNITARRLYSYTIFCCSTHSSTYSLVININITSTFNNY